MGENLRWKLAEARCAPCALTASVNVPGIAPLQK
jgi:hypothetical protein